MSLSIKPTHCFITFTLRLEENHDEYGATVCAFGLVQYKFTDEYWLLAYYLIVASLRLVTANSRPLIIISQFTHYGVYLLKLLYLLA